MHRRHRKVNPWVLVAALLVAGGVSQTIAAPEENSKRVDLYAELKALPDPLARYQFLKRAVAQSVDPARQNEAAQRLAIAAAEIGEYGEAERVYPRYSAHSANNKPASMPMDAAGIVVDSAKTRRVVMVNEAHHVARTRLLTLYLLEPLRRAGFTHLALEALGHDDSELRRRGYATDGTGTTILSEPVFAEIVREALRLGYTLVPYEHTGTVPAGVAGVQPRETGQAENLARLLREEPKARVLVHAGYAHVFRNDREALFGAFTMVEELDRLTGECALTVDQTLLLDHADSTDDHPAYAEGVARWRAVHDGVAPSRPFVLIDAHRAPWSLRPEVFDISVFAAPTTLDEAWRGLDRRRARRELSNKSCANVFPCLVEARRRGDSEDAVPADRSLLREVRPAMLWLAEGCYRVEAITEAGRQRAPDYCTGPTAATLAP